MSFFDHLEELRWHIVRSLAAVLFFSITAFVFNEFVFESVIFGPKSKDFVTYRVLCSLSDNLGLGKTLCMQPPKFDFITKEVGELFFTDLKVAFMVGLICAIPYLFWEIWRFVKPGLYEKERRTARNAVGICSFLFFLGVFFGYFVISPFAITFLIGYNLPGVEEMQTPIGSYINYMVMLTFPVGLVFELPVAAYVLTKLGVLSSNFMKTHRKHAVAIIIVLSAIITPPDVVSQILIALPLIGLYQIGIVIAKRVEKKEMALAKT